MTDRPTIDLRKLEKDDHRAAMFIQNGIRDIGRYMDDFAAAVSLFDFSETADRQLFAARPNILSPERDAWREQSRRYTAWMMIAARDGAMTIFHFGKAYEGIRASLKSCSSLDNLVNHAKLTEAGRLLRKHFPRFEAIRHPVAHSAEFHRNEKVWNEHAFSGPYDDGFISIGPAVKKASVSQNLANRVFSVTFEGEVFSYEVNKTSLDALRQIVDTTFAAFDAAVIQWPR